MSQIYRYTFNSQIPIEDVEASMVLALLGAEALHGETEVQLAGCHVMDTEHRSCVVDASSPVGHDVNRLFAGFLRREFGPSSFRIQRVATADKPPAPSTA